MKILRIIARLNVGGPARHVVWLTQALQGDGAPFAVDVDPQAGRCFFNLGLDFAVAQPQKVFRQEPPP